MFESTDLISLLKLNDLLRGLRLFNRKVKIGHKLSNFTFYLNFIWDYVILAYLSFKHYSVSSHDVSGVEALQRSENNFSEISFLFPLLCGA